MLMLNGLHCLILLSMGLFMGVDFCSYAEFRLHACEFFKLVCPRKRSIDGTSEYDSAITQIFRILMNISSDFLQKSGSAAIDESELEFAEYLCESMVSLGSSNLQSVSGNDDAILSLYCRQLQLMRLVASHKPHVAVTKVLERIVEIVHRLLHLPNPSQELAIMESMELPLKNIVGAIFDGSNDFSQIPSDTVRETFSGLLKQLLSLQWTEPDLVEVLGHYLDSLGELMADTSLEAMSVNHFSKKYEE